MTVANESRASAGEELHVPARGYQPSGGLSGDMPGDRNVNGAARATRSKAGFAGLSARTRGFVPRGPEMTESADLQALRMPEEGLEPPTRGL
jgi:hypothetical protein